MTSGKQLFKVELLNLLKMRYQNLMACVPHTGEGGGQMQVYGQEESKQELLS